MATTIPGSSSAFDDDGFLVDLSQWNRGLAKDLALQDGIPELSSNHWKIIYYLREHYYKNHSLPVMRHVCHVHDLPAHCVDELFHNCKEAWRIAGLPNPGEEAKTYM